jgi:thiamine biosynthesis lipoprotein
MSTLSKVDYRKVRVNSAYDSVFFATREVRLDVGGVAKGFATREVGRLLERMGVGRYLISSGGDILAKGRRADGNRWRVGIQHPRRPDAMLGVFELDGGAVFTSGDYERYRMTPSGERVHHIFDARRGHSCLTNQSVTIRSPDPLRAKMLSTGLFCRDARDIVAFVEARPPLECVVVDSSGAVVMSKGWRDQVRLITETD